jgi:hypothetical protein
MWWRREKFRSSAPEVQPVAKSLYRLSYRGSRMKKYGEAKVQFHAFITSELDGGVLLARSGTHARTHAHTVHSHDCSCHISQLKIHDITYTGSPMKPTARSIHRPPTQLSHLLHGLPSRLLRLAICATSVVTGLSACSLNSKTHTG